MKRILIAMFVCMFAILPAFAVDADTPTAPSNPSDPTKPTAPTYGPLYSIFSTSTDWQAVTGLRLNEYRGTFMNGKKLAGKKGLVLYYLDGFPCYGLGSWVRAWVSPMGRADERLHIACVHAPVEIKFAYRNATADATQNATTGLLTCPVSASGRDFSIDLNKCTVGPEWKEYD